MSMTLIRTRIARVDRVVHGTSREKGNAPLKIAVIGVKKPPGAGG